MKAVISIAARMASSRLPGKVMADVLHVPLLHRIVGRLQLSGIHVVVATTSEMTDRPIVEAMQGVQVDVLPYGGDTDDLMGRHAMVARLVGADIILLAGADDPFLDPAMFMKLRDLMETGRYAYAKTAGWPLGMNAWAWTREAMEDGDRLAKEPDERQHVVPFWERRPRQYRKGLLIRAGVDLYNRFRLTVDNQEDLDLARAIYGILGSDFDPEDVIDLLERYPSLALMNGIHLHGTAARDAIYDVTPIDERVMA